MRNFKMYVMSKAMQILAICIIVLKNMYFFSKYVLYKNKLIKRTLFKEFSI
jgi:hypothetical protein